MKLLVLYTELAAYFHACVQHLVHAYDAEAKVFMWPINPQAPFQFASEPGIQIHEKNAFPDQQLLEACKTYNPDIIYVSGWSDKAYLAVARHFYQQGTPVICGMDNQWFGRWRQRLATLASPFLLKNKFSHFWVPGMFQYEYVRRLGYARERILTGVYCADHRRFYEAYQRHRPLKAQAYPKNFLYVGRLSPEKGTLNLYRAFQALVAEGMTDWKLTFIGTGPEGAHMQPSEQIDMRGFIHPRELPELAREGGCLVFPSLRDAWGVSIHEFAAAGLPLVATDAAGAITAFVRHGYNGYAFERGKEASLKQALRNIMQLDEQALLEMGDRSAQLSLQLTPESWATTLLSVLEQPVRMRTRPLEKA